MSENKEEKEKTNRNYDLFFKNKEMKAMEINQKIDNLLEYYNYDADFVKSHIKSLYGYEEEFISYTMIKNDINSLTDIDLNKFEDIIIENIKRNDVVKDAKKDKDVFIIDTEKGIMKFTTIGTFFNHNILNIDYNNASNINNNDTVSNEIYSEIKRQYLNNVKRKENRRKRCHGLSIKGSEILKKCLSIDNFVVTGYAYENIDKVKYLHSWIEFEYKGEQYVIDSTLNIVMNKSGYYLLMHIKEKEIESVVDSQLIIDDFNDFGDFILYTEDAKTYLTCRDLMIKDLNRNKAAFNNINDNSEAAQSKENEEER